MRKISRLHKNKFIVFVSSFIFCSSCNHVYDCPEYGYNNGWLKMQSTYNHTYELTFIENCFANGSSIVFYENGIIKEYGTMKNGEKVNKWYHYNEAGELVSITEH